MWAYAPPLDLVEVQKQIGCSLLIAQANLMFVSLKEKIKLKAHYYKSDSLLLCFAKKVKL